MGLGETTRYFFFTFLTLGEAGWPWLATSCLGLRAVNSKKGKEVKT